VKLFILSIFIFLLSCGSPSQNPSDRIEALGSQLRCPVCRGVPISESPATLAVEMMGILKDQIAQGKTDLEILAYFEERYGEWVLLQPKPQGANLLIWILPLLLLVGGSLFILKYVKKEPL
jgi:cytochrome c-type biogenesis protein CcmH